MRLDPSTDPAVNAAAPARGPRRVRSFLRCSGAIALWGAVATTHVLAEPVVTVPAASAASQSSPVESRPLGPARSVGVPGEHAPPGTATNATAVARGPRTESSAGGLGITRTVASLAAVLVLAGGLGYGVRWLSRKQGGLAFAMGPGGRAPSGVLHVLGRFPIARGLSLVLLRVDRRVLLLSQSGGRRQGQAMTTLCEITDPEEVASMVAKCAPVINPAEAAAFSATLNQSQAEIERVLRAMEPRPAPQARPDPVQIVTPTPRAAAPTAPARSARPATVPAQPPVNAARPASSRPVGPTAADSLRDRLAAMQAPARQATRSSGPPSPSRVGGRSTGRSAA